MKLRDVQEAAALLKRGEVVAFPTETVYGLGASIFNPNAIAKIFALKKRPQDNPLIAHISDLSEIERIAIDIPPEVELLAEAFFPGPLAIVLKKHPNVPAIVSPGNTIALRMPNHALARALIQLVGEPLVAPSANLSGRPSPTTAEHVLEDLDVPVLDGGPCVVGIESTVISLCEKPLLLRPGVISQEEIESVLGRKIAKSSDAKMSPGMKYRHYAPKAKVFLFETKEALERHLKVQKKRVVATPANATVYSLLRDADIQDCEEVCFLCDEKVRAQVGLMDRLQRAANS